MANHTRITRPLRTDYLVFPDHLPRPLRSFLYTQVDLVLPGESLHLDELADRVKATATTSKDAAYATFLKRWMELMLFAEDCVVNTGYVPLEFRYAGTVYQADQIISLLGSKAMDYLASEQPAHAAA